jgi:cytochrome P450
MKSRISAGIALLGALILSHEDRHNYSAFALRFISLFLAQRFLLFTYNVFIYPFYYSPLRHLPGPKVGAIFYSAKLSFCPQLFSPNNATSLTQAQNGHPFLGLTPAFISAESANDMPLAIMKTDPSAPLLRYLHLANSEWVLVNSVQACREMLQTKCYQFQKPGYFRRIVGEIAGVGLVNAEGEVHRRQRRLLNGPLGITNVKKIVPVFNDKAAELVGRISAHVEESPGVSIEALEVLSKTTLDVIGLASLGVELHSLSTEGSTLNELYTTVFDQSPVGQLISVINMFIPVRKWLPLKANRDFLHAASEIQRVLRESIRERKKEIFGGNEGVKREFTEEGSRDLLTFMLYERSEGSNKWSEDDILGHLRNFVAAGHDTTAVALTWAFLTLCVQPDIQSRLRNEVQEHIPQDRAPTAAELDNLPYLNLFFKEVIRCFSSTTLIPRTPTEDGVTLCGTVIPKGTTCLLNPQTIQFNPSIWGPDAETFDPDRHHPDDPRQKEFPDCRDPYAIATFSNGPRMCIGKAFAGLEFKSVIVAVVRAFELERAWDEEGKRLDEGVKFEGNYNREGNVYAGVKLQNAITIRPRDGIWVRFRPLDPSSSVGDRRDHQHAENLG